MGNEKRYILGKVDYNRNGRKDCEAAFTYTLESNRFSMCAEIWNPRKTDIYVGGQCCEEVAAYFPNDKQAQRMLEIWRRWHLNDMKAGSPAQMQYLKENPIPPEDYAHPASYYTVASLVLERAGLNPDPDYLHEGKPYEYGSAWLKEELPPEIVQEIITWNESKDY